jgi:hypothetical protein
MRMSGSVAKRLSAEFFAYDQERPMGCKARIKFSFVRGGFPEILIRGAFCFQFLHELVLRGEIKHLRSALE